MSLKMKKYFAELSGDLLGMENYVRFEDFDMKSAQETADEYAESNYGGFGDPFDEDDCPNFSADVKEYDPDKHDKYFKGLGKFKDSSDEVTV